MNGRFPIVLRVIIVLVVGVSLVVYPLLTVGVLIYVLGMLFVVPGIVQLLRYAIVKRKIERHGGNVETVKFPYLSALSIAIGITIMLCAAAMARVFPALLGAALVFTGLYKLFLLWRSKMHRSARFWIIPMLLLVLGLFILINPFEIVDKVLVVMFGVSCVVYCVDEVLHMINGQ